MNRRTFLSLCAAAALPAREEAPARPRASGAWLSPCWDTPETVLPRNAYLACDLETRRRLYLTPGGRMLLEGQQRVYKGVLVFQAIGSQINACVSWGAILCGSWDEFDAKVVLLREGAR